MNNKTRMTVRGGLVLGFLAGAIGATIVVSYCYWLAEVVS